MIRTTWLLLFFPLFLSPALSQPGLPDQNWSWQNPIPQGNMLMDIMFVDHLSGWAIGDVGTVMHTTNGGESWEVNHAPTHDLLSAGSFVNASTGWVLTYISHKIFRTTDGGTTWDSISTIPGGISDIEFVNDLVGFAAGNDGNIWRSTDGGTSWTLLETNSFDYLNALCFPSDSVGWAVAAEGWALRTTDGGDHWTRTHTGGIYPSSRQVHALDGAHAYIVGSHDFWGQITGFLYSTTNGGVTWTEQYFDQILSDVFFSSPDTGWIANIDGLILGTTNGGSVWDTLAGKSSRFSFSGSEFSWGYSGISSIFATTDGWQSSHPQTFSVSTDFHWSVSAYDSNYAVACGTSSKIVATTDGGRKWSVLYSPGNETYLNDIVQLSAEEIIAVGQSGLVVRTSDGGLNWHGSTLASTWLSGITFMTEDIGFITGSSGTLFRTEDRGKSWDEDTTITGTSLEKIAFAHPSLGWMGSDAGAFRSTDFGASWQLVYASSIALYHDVSAAGNSAWFPWVNSVLHTTDGGNTWTITEVYPVGSAIYDIRCLAFIDELNGWAGSNSGLIYRTTNGGFDWYLEADLNGQPLYGLSFGDPHNGWAVGSGGTILHYGELTTSVPTFDGRPRHFSLHQNYPNPFNPRTNISFSLPGSGRVSLKIFNLLGEEAATLVLGQRDAGTHTVQWDATGQPSGVYFYRLQSGEFVETRKLVLLR